MKKNTSSVFSRPVSVSAATTIGKTFVSLGEVLPAEFEQQFGRLNMEWGSLDYVMRITCKRLEGVNIGSDRGKKIMQCANHGTIISWLNTATNQNKEIDDSTRQRLEDILKDIGTERNAGLYGRRNAILHSFWTFSPECQLVRQRVGTDEWRQPVAVTQEELSKLCGDIREVWQGLLRLTEPLLNPVEPKTSRNQC
jgi:hypothetical protein